MANEEAPGLRVAATADLHGFLPDVPTCDILLVAGDLCPVNDHHPDRQRNWLEGPFTDWLTTANANSIVGIAGNHDFLAEEDLELMRSLPWTYLCDESTVIDGLLIHGSPWTPTFGTWAFMRPDPELTEQWVRIPDDVDLLLTHGPPFGHGDLTVSGELAGSETLAQRLPELERLRLHVFGHIHEGGGYLRHADAALLANVSYVDEHYRPVGRTAVFDL